MLDLMIKGYIAARLKMESLAKEQRGLAGLEYAVLAGIIQRVCR